MKKILPVILPSIKKVTNHNSGSNHFFSWCFNFVSWRSTLVLGLFTLLAVLIIQPIFVLGAELASSANEVGGNSAEIDALNKAIAEKKNKIKQLESSIAEYKTKISQKRLEAVSLSNQMAIIDNRISQVELDIKATQEKMDSLNLEIEALALSIEDKETVIKKQKEILARLIRVIRQNDNKNYLEIAASYDNFSDFFNQMQNVQSVEKDLGQSVSSIRALKEELEIKRAETEDRKLTYEQLSNTLQQRKLDLEDQSGVKENLLAETKLSEQKFSTLLGSLNKQYQQIENEISSYEREVRRKLEAQNKLETGTTDGSKLSWPTQSRYVTAYFHDPDYPYRHVFEHSGIDIRASQGTALKATASGYVARAKRCSLSSCYSYVMIIHSGGISTLYGHMSGINVSEDQFVNRGDVIGYSGGTPGTVGAGPFVTGAHLHFEVRLNGIPVNPLNYLVRDW